MYKKSIDLSVLFKIWILDIKNILKRNENKKKRKDYREKKKNKKRRNCGNKTNKDYQKKKWQNTKKKGNKEY